MSHENTESPLTHIRAALSSSQNVATEPVAAQYIGGKLHYHSSNSHTPFTLRRQFQNQKKKKKKMKNHVVRII